jgi:hypothetical protein
MEEACAFQIPHWNNGVTRSIDISDSVSIRLGAIHHKSLEVDIRDSIFKHSSVQVLLEENLHDNVFKLHITTSNGQFTKVLTFVYVICHCCLVLYLLHVVEHDPWKFYILGNLHPLYKVNIATCQINKHLEDKYLISR